MLYLFYGSDSEKARRKAFEWVAAARKKEPNLAYMRLAREDLSEGALLEAATANSLFAKRTLTLIDDPYQESEEETEAVLDDYIDILANSENVIVILAPKLLATKAKKLGAKAKLEYRFDKAATREDARGFNANLVNALESRSCERLWLEITRAQRAGDAPEMLHGLLHWKARDLMEKGSRVWTAQESRQLSLSLISLLQDSRRGGLSLSESLERFALSV